MKGNNQHRISTSEYLDSHLSYKIYYDKIKDNRPLTRDEEFHYFEAYKKKGSEKAKKAIVDANLRFVVKIACGYKNQGVDFEDLISAGNMGLLIAIEEFNYTKGLKFISYAVWWIRQQILEELAKQSRFIGITGVEANKKSNLEKDVRKLEQELGRKPTINEISKKVKMTSNRIIHMLNMLDSQISLDAKVRHSTKKNTNQDTVKDVIEDKNSSSPDQYISQNIKERIISILDEAHLSEKEKDVMKRYYGLEHDVEYSLEEIGRKYNQTRERMRQLKERCLKALVKMNDLRRKAGQPYLSRELLVD